MLEAIFVVLVLILLVLITMVPKSARVELYSIGKIIIWCAVAIAVAIAVFYLGLFLYGLVRASSAPMWQWLILPAVALLGYLFYQDYKETKEVRAGNPHAIESRIATLMRDHKFTREEAEAAIQELQRKT